MGVTTRKKSAAVMIGLTMRPSAMPNRVQITLKGWSSAGRKHATRSNRIAMLKAVHRAGW